MHAKLLKKDFSTKRIAVVGDLVADQFLRGTIERVSREAPVFIMRHDETETRAGGAANAAVNVSTLGGKAIAVGLIGEDAEGEKLRKVLEAKSVDCKLVLSHADYKTNTKVRVLAGQHYAQRQQVIRIDYENDKQIDSDTAGKIKQNALKAIEEAEALIISDYGYGAAEPEIVTDAIQKAKEKDIPVVIDSRLRLGEFRDATSATPNQDEVEQILGEDFTESDCDNLRRELKLDALLVTRGNEGMTLFEKDKAPLSLDAVGLKQPVDVTGAGDTVIAAYVLGLASGMGFEDAARIANHAGGIVVMKKGTASVSADELAKSLSGEGGFKTKGR